MNTETITEIDVDLERTLPCEELDEPCDRAATWRIKWSCKCGNRADNICDVHVGEYKRLYDKGPLVCAICAGWINADTVRFVRI